MGKPGTANIISVSDHAGYLSKSDIAGVLKVASLIAGKPLTITVMSSSG